MFLVDSTSGIVVVTILVTTMSTSLIVVSDGECNVVGDCVHSPNYPSDYGSNLACDIRF